jgi:hypothetical protein
MINHARILTLVAAATLGAAVLGGCGGGGDSAAERTGASADAASEKAAPDQGSEDERETGGSARDGGSTRPETEGHERVSDEPSRERVADRARGSGAQAKRDADAAREPVEEQRELRRPLGEREEYARCLESPAAELEGCGSISERVSEARDAARERREQRRMDRCVREAGSQRQELACLPPELGGPGGDDERLSAAVRRCQEEATTTEQKHRCLTAAG